MSLVSKMGSTPSGCQGIAANVVKSYTSDFDSDFFDFKPFYRYFKTLFDPNFEKLALKGLKNA